MVRSSSPNATRSLVGATVRSQYHFGQVPFGVLTLGLAFVGGWGGASASTAGDVAVSDDQLV